MEKYVPNKSFKKKPTASDVATLWFVIHASIHALKGILSGNEMRVTRADSKFVNEVLEPMMDQYNNIIVITVADINDEKVIIARKSMIKLNSVKRRRRFLKNVSEPEDESLRFCPVSQCKNTVDMPDLNAGVIERNKEKLEEFYEEKNR